MTLDQLAAQAAAIVSATQHRLPPDVQAAALPVPVHYEDYPGEAVLDDGFDPDILGLFVGHSHEAELSASYPAPPQIFLYLGNLWDFAEGDEAAFRREVRLTYLHELGHYLGWDEDALAARGLE